MAFGIDDIIGVGLRIIDKFIPDPAEKLKAQQALQQMQHDELIAFLEADKAVTVGQLEINKTEAASSSPFTSGWRPFVGWTCGAGFAVQFVVGPLGEWASALAEHPVKFPQIDLGTMMPLLFGMLGLGAYRTAEKIQGVTR